MTDDATERMDTGAGNQKRASRETVDLDLTEPENGVGTKTGAPIDTAEKGGARYTSASAFKSEAISLSGVDKESTGEIEGNTATAGAQQESEEQSSTTKEKASSEGPATIPPTVPCPDSLKLDRTQRPHSPTSKSVSQADLPPPVTLPVNQYYRHQDLDLSPIKRPRKSVAFSDNLASDASDHWGSDAPTPQRSILKTLRELLHKFSTARCLPRSRAFWDAGTIVVLEARLPDLPELVAGCAEVLADEEFDRKFEVYATLSQVCKSNDAATLAEIFVRGSSPPSPMPSFGGFAFAKNNTNKNGSHKNAFLKRNMSSPQTLGPSDNQGAPLVGARLVHFARRDILAGEAHLFRAHHNDPFQARILGQALKVTAFWLAVPAINNSLHHEDVEWLYTHACDMLAHPAISKSLVLPYLCLIKECHYSALKRPSLFANSLPRQMLDALLAIRSFPSSSLVNEKLACLKSLVQNFPSSMAESFNRWFPGLIICLCDTQFHLHTKTVASGITSLLEAARTYLDAPRAGRMAREFLDSLLPQAPFLFADNKVPLNSSTPAVDFVCTSLKEMIDAGHCKFAMDIWVGLLLLTSHADLPLETWTHTPAWLLVHRYCFNVASIAAKATALSSWKVVIYKICCVDLQEPSVWLRASGQLLGSGYESVKPKLRLLVHLFVNMTSSGYRSEVVDALHQAFLAILFNLLGSLPQPLMKQLSMYWDRVFLPVFSNFYFHKELATPHMHHLGYTVLLRLLRPSNPNTERSFSWTRCLSNEHVLLSEISSLSPRWVHLQLETILPMLVTVLKLDSVTVDEKLACVNALLNSMKYITKKEVLPSNSTLDLIDNLPYVLRPVFETTQPSYDEIFKLIVTLNDTFSASNLVTNSQDGSGSYLVILSFCSKTFTPHQLNAILSMLQGAVGERKLLLFLSNLCRVCQTWNCQEEVFAFVGDCLGSKKYSRFSHQDMSLLSFIFENIHTNFAGPAKKLIQQIVLLKADEFEKTVADLKLVKWNIQIFKFFVTLMHDAPFDHLKRTSLELIRVRSQNPDDFFELFVLLTDSKFNYEIHCLRTEICHNIQFLGSDKYLQLWKEYLSAFEGPVEDLDDLLTSSLKLDLEIHDLAKGRWGNLPNLRKCWLEKFNDAVWENDANFVVSNEQLSSRQGELESMIASDIIEHSNSEPTIEQLAQDASQISKSIDYKAAEITTKKPRGRDSNSFSLDSDIFVRESPPPVETVSVTNQSSATTEKNGMINLTMSPIKPSATKRTVAPNANSRRRSKRIQTRRVGEESDNSSDSSALIELTVGNDDESTEKVQEQVVKSEKLTVLNPGEPAKAGTDAATKQVSDSEDSSRVGDKGCIESEKCLEIVSSVDSEENKSVGTNETGTCFKDTSFNGNATVGDISTFMGDISAGTNSDRRLSTVEEVTIQVDGPLDNCMGLDKLRKHINQITSFELNQMTPQQKYDLETEMMQFILRMRRVTSDTTSYKD